MLCSVESSRTRYYSDLFFSSINKKDKEVLKLVLDFCIFNICYFLSYFCGLKDIATRVIAPEVSLEDTPVSKVMTRNPVFVLSETLAVEALQKMVQGWLYRQTIETHVTFQVSCYSV